MALTEYDDNREVVEEERYGELIIEHYGWGNNSRESGEGAEAEGNSLQSELSSGSSAIGYHYCSDEELGLTIGPKTHIFPIFEGSKNEVMTWRKKFKCVD